MSTLKMEMWGLEQSKTWGNLIPPPQCLYRHTGHRWGQEGLRVNICFVLCDFLHYQGQKDKSITYPMAVHWQFLTAKEKTGLGNTLFYGWPQCTSQGRGETFILLTSPVHVRATGSAPSCKWPLRLLQDTWKCFISGNAEGEKCLMACSTQEW